MLLKKLFNVGFEAIEVIERAPVSLDLLATSPVLPPEFVRLLRTIVPAQRHDQLVASIVVIASKPPVR